MTTDFRTLNIKAGDVLVVKLGDPASGYIPSPESEQHVHDMFATLIERRGLTGQVDVLIYHYAMQLEVLSPETPVRDAHSDALLRNARDLIDAQAARIAELEAAAPTFIPTMTWLDPVDFVPGTFTFEATEPVDFVSDTLTVNDDLVYGARSATANTTQGIALGRNAVAHAPYPTTPGT